MVSGSHFGQDNGRALPSVQEVLLGSSVRRALVCLRATWHSGTLCLPGEFSVCESHLPPRLGTPSEGQASPVHKCGINVCGVNAAL